MMVTHHLFNHPIDVVSGLQKRRTAAGDDLIKGTVVAHTVVAKSTGVALQLPSSGHGSLLIRAGTPTVNCNTN